MTPELNEITILMAINAVLMIGLMGMFLHLSITTLLGGNKVTEGSEHYSRV